MKVILTKEDLKNIKSGIQEIYKQFIMDNLHNEEDFWVVNFYDFISTKLKFSDIDS